jgi:3-mercaptopyruvate sulfurtransferase SseA
MLILFCALAIGVAAQANQGIQVDPQTGRAVGAREISAEDVKKLVDAHGKVLVIDVREPDSFQKETIKGAINIPLGQLESRLKDIPKDTTLVFT